MKTTTTKLLALILTAAAGMGGVCGARAGCLPLPSLELATLERLTSRAPEAAVAEARRRLALAAAHPDPLLEGELQAIIADALGQEGRVEEGHAATAAARRALAPLPDSDRKRRVLNQLDLSDVLDAESRTDLVAGVRAMSAIIAREPQGSNESACALASRADLRAELLELDLAAADGLAAYGAAQRGGFIDARIRAAASLATIYRRSGLYDNAERMIDEAIQFERAEGGSAQLAAATYVLGQIQFAAGHDRRARDTLEESRRIAAAAGDSFGAAFTDVALCPVLIAGGALDEAQRVCNANVGVFAAAKRNDLVTLLLGHLARIDLERGHPEAALAKLDEVLGPRADDVLPSMEPQFYQYRSRAQGALGRFREAYDDLAHSLELQRLLDVEQRARVAAVLTAARDADQSEAERRALTRRIWWVAGIGAALILGLIAYLLLQESRHERTLERTQRALRAASASTPDTLMLLDAQRMVRFANRALFGRGPTPVLGVPLARTVEPEVWAVLEAGLAAVYERQQPSVRSLGVPDERGAVRQFELRCAPVIEGALLVGATVRSIDMTEVRSLEKEVLDISTRERQRLSSELHDGLGQELTGIALLLRNLVTALERGRAGTGPLLDEIMDYTNRAIVTTRDIARGLSPMQVERGSLSRAFTRLAAEAGRRLHLAISARSEPADIVVAEEAADHLYRIAFEAITNAARHSGCSRIGVSLRRESDRVSLIIEDDGRGLPAGERSGSGLGLKTMAYRARLLGGSFALESPAGGGARVRVVVPMGPASLSGYSADPI